MSFRVKVPASGHEFEVENDETVLEAALRQGIGLPYGCRNGACGKCAGELISGEVRYAKELNSLALEQQQQGKTLFCQARPQSDLEIAARQAGKPMALAKRYFSEAETAALSLLGEEELHRAFMHTWACKEAIVKASGMGIANQLCRFTVDVNPDNPPSVLDMPDDDHAAWKLAIAEPARGAIAAIAVRQQAIRLEGFNLL